MPRRIHGTMSRSTAPKAFEAHCTACDWDGVAYTPTCPECSRRTLKAGPRK